MKLATFYALITFSTVALMYLLLWTRDVEDPLLEIILFILRVLVHMWNFSAAIFTHLFYALATPPALLAEMLECLQFPV